MQVIIFENSHGGVSVCTPTGDLPIEQVLVKDCPEGAIIVNENILPKDDDFFNAWELNNNVVSVNLEKSKEITKTRLRAEREPLLQAQDVAFQRALETGANTTAIVVEKQRLRDITKLADSANSLEELRLIKVK